MKVQIQMMGIIILVASLITGMASTAASTQSVEAYGKGFLGCIGAINNCQNLDCSQTSKTTIGDGELPLVTNEGSLALCDNTNTETPP